MMNDPLSNLAHSRPTNMILLALYFCPWCKWFFLSVQMITLLSICLLHVNVIAVWLRREGDVNKMTGIPTWRSLVKTLWDHQVRQEGIVKDISIDKDITTEPYPDSFMMNDLSTNLANSRPTNMILLAIYFVHGVNDSFCTNILCCQLYVNWSYKNVLYYPTGKF